MLTEIHAHPMRYLPGTHVSSSQGRDIAGILAISVPVGGDIIIPEGLTKLFTTERIGKLVIERCFFSVPTAGKKELFPIFIKIFDVGEAHILLIKEGIQCFMNFMNHESKKVQFLNNVLFKCAMTELECIDRDLYSSLNDFYDSAQYSEHLANDTSAAIVSHPSILSVGYPWDIGNVMSNSLQIEVRQRDTTAHRTFANWMHELSLQVSLYYDDDMVPNRHPLFMELIDKFAPKVGELYEPITFDQLTSTCMDEPTISTSTLLKSSGILAPASSKMLTENPQGWKDEDYEKVTLFSSELLHLCVWVHQLPFYEFGLRYTLPIRDVVTGLVMTPSNMNIYYASLRNGFPPQGDLRDVLDRVLRYWDLSQYTAIDIVKTGRDELFLTFVGSNTRRMYIDLTLTTLLSQSIVRID